MAENENFVKQLQEALNHKGEWFNTIRLQEMLEQYRIMHSCVKNLFDMLVQKSLIIPDPYRLDKKISDIVVPETTFFSDSEAISVLGARFSEYEVMLDFLCTYYRFSIEGLTIPVTKKLLDFNKVFEWEEFSTNSSKPNTKALADALNESKKNASSVVLSMITDSINKNADAVLTINKILSEVGSYQKELYKLELRRDLFDHPEFNKEKASASPEAEMAEIKRLYTKVMGKKPFYTDLINEIVQEDVGPNAEANRAGVLRSLDIPVTQTKKTVKKAEPSDKEMLMETVLAIAAMSPTLTQLRLKLNSNFDLVFAKKKNFFTKFSTALRKIFHIKDKERICTIQVSDAKTGSVRLEKIKVNEFMMDLSKRERIYGAVSLRDAEYAKIEGSSAEAIMNFINKQISETQSLFTIINALDGYFKTAVDIMQRSKVKGMQIELSALRNSIINSNKKRGDYIVQKEEKEQMSKLGISNNEQN